ncbi:MAG: hypothetical protein GXY25_05575 [Pirellulaceae bacterium]|jgi:hypothetical protein|nr:hypothetical protein [Thermoguttaceae bacterium]MDI9444395.1 hypothetical protein [Planctomycetota bacterium]NLY99989.1 hypothetical protein [Pirellulaceae bacterium]
MENKSPAAIQWQDDWDRSDFPLDRESRAFQRFSSRIDRQLRKLVAAWAHLAAPNALRSQRRISSPAALRRP